MQSDVCFFEIFKEEEKLLKENLPERLTAEFVYDSIQDARLKDPPAKLISIRTHSLIPETWLENGKIHGILSRSTGFDHLKDFPKKIPCGYLPEYCSTAVAEQAILLYMSLARRLPEQINHFQNFDRDNLTGIEIEGKNAVVVGVGRIGHKVYNRLANGLGMKVYGVDIVERHNDVSYVKKDDGLKIADVIFCCMNMTKENVSYFSYETLKKTKPGVCFINTSRGEFSPSVDLLKLIEEKHLGGLALDVYKREALLEDALRNRNHESSPISDEEVKAALELAEKDNVIFTPHNSFNTRESTKRKAQQTIEQLTHFLEEGEFIWKVSSE